MRRFPAAAVVAAACLMIGVVSAPATASDGQLETSWAVSGVRPLPWSFGPVRATADIAAGPGGRLILVGSDNMGIGCVTRLTAAGGLDAGFGAQAGLTGSLCDLDNGAPGAVGVVQATATGDLVAAGVTTDNRFVARIDAQGTIQWVNELQGNFTASGGRVLDVAPLSDGRTALLETRDSSGSGWVTLIEESGSVLGVWEVPSLDAGGAFRPHQLRPGRTGTLLLVGELDLDQGSITSALRTDQAGRPDTTFSSDGFSDGPPNTSGQPGRGALGPSGEVLLAATTGTGVVVRRLTSSGAVDTSFRTTGTSATLPSGTVAIDDLVVRPDGRVFLVFQGAPGSTAIHVARLTSAGSLDATFSGDGYASLGAGAVPNGTSIAAALAPRGDLFVLARDPAGISDPAVVLVDGTNDVAPPVAAMTRPSSRWALSTSVPLAWTATDVSPVVSYDVRARTTSFRGAFPAPTPLVSGTATRTRTVAAVGGTTFCASSRARDVWGYLSAWSSERCTSVPLTPAQLTKGKGVTTKSSAGTYTGKVLSATKKGSTISRSGVKAKRIALVVTTCSSCGKVRVYIGSDLLKTVSLKSAGTRKKVVISIATFSRVRSGTVKVKVVTKGKKVLVGIGVSKV